MGGVVDGFGFSPIRPMAAHDPFAPCVRHVLQVSTYLHAAADSDWVDGVVVGSHAHLVITGNPITDNHAARGAIGGS